MTQVLIKRELLEQVASEFEHDNDRYMLGRELRKVLDAPRQSECEEPVAWMNPYGGVLQKRITGLERETFTIPLYTAPQPGKDVRALVSADDVRDACANAVSVFAEETNAGQCREVAEYMREVLLAQIARRQAQRPV